VRSFARSTGTAVVSHGRDAPGSDVVVGAFVAIASARTVTWQIRGARLKVVPARVPGGAAISLVYRQ
jgi:hypothetical protein